MEPEIADLGLSDRAGRAPARWNEEGQADRGDDRSSQGAGKAPEGLWMPLSVRLVEELLAEGRLRLKRNPVLISAMMSAVTDEDRWGNHWITKERSVNKIDAAVALCMAIGVLTSVPTTTFNAAAMIA
jgi:hypothetical protein